MTMYADLDKSEPLIYLVTNTGMVLLASDCLVVVMEGKEAVGLMEEAPSERQALAKQHLRARPLLSVIP